MGNEQPIVFNDLSGLACADRTLNASEDRWLADLAVHVQPNVHAISLAPSSASQDSGPVLERQLDGSWQAGRYVGELRQGDRVLEIRPRLGIEIIAAWAGSAFNLRIVPQAAEDAGTAPLIVEITAAIWRTLVADATRYGLPGLRVLHAHQGPSTRGRLDVAGTVALRTKGVPHLASIQRAKLLDNPVSRSIVLAERVLDARLHRRPGWSGDRVAEILPRLRGATGARPRLPSRREMSQVRYTPITLKYRRAAELSWQIARRGGARAAATNDTTDGLLIDVAELWELFVLHCTRRATTAKVTHGTYGLAAQSLLRSDSDRAATLGRLYPDIIVGSPAFPNALIDAKYKPLADPRGVDREDLYQLTSYLAAHTSDPPPLGVLAYPLFEEHPPAYAERLGPWRSPQENLVQFARLPITEQACIEAISTMLPAGER